MSGPGRKHAACSDDNPPPKKWGVSAKMVEKWIAENDKALSRSTWLKYDKADREYVATMKCSVCIEFQDKLRDMCNYSNAFIGGSKNLRASSFKDHTASDMHARAMLLLKKQSSSDVTEYTPIAKALHTLDSDAEGKLKHKFDTAFFISKENLAFGKMGALCELEERHRVDLGQGYKNNKACARFVDYIADEQRQILVGALAGVKCFSLQADSSTDAGNVEDELFLVLYFDSLAKDGKVHVHDRFLTVR